MRLLIKKISWCHFDIGGIFVIFTDQSKVFIPDSVQVPTAQIMRGGAIVESTEKNGKNGKMIIARAINESTFLPLGECYFVSLCGGIESLPEVNKKLFKYLLFSPEKEIKEIIDSRQRVIKRIDPEIAGL